MTLSGESAGSPNINPFDAWSQTEQANLQAAAVERMEERNPGFMNAVRQWATLLMDGELGPYDQPSKPIYAAEGAQYPSRTVYGEDPYAHRHGFVEYDAEESEGPDLVHLALDAVVRKYNPDAFVAVARPKMFDPYSDHSNPRCYVLGNRRNDKQDPSEAADKALVVRTGWQLSGELAPRYSLEGHAAREAAKVAREEAQRRLSEAQESARNRGGLVGQYMARVLGVGLADALAENGRTSDEVDQALRHVWVSDPTRPGNRTTPRGVNQLREFADSADTRDILNALASLYPNDTIEQLLARAAAMIASATQHE